MIRWSGPEGRVEDLLENRL